MRRACALLLSLPLVWALPHDKQPRRHRDVDAILEKLHELSRDVDEHPSLEAHHASTLERHEEGRELASPDLEGGGDENAQWVQSMQIALDKNLKGDIVAGFSLNPLRATERPPVQHTVTHSEPASTFHSPASDLGASWERKMQSGGGGAIQKPTELVRFPVTLNSPLKAAGAEYWDLSAHEGKAGMRYHMKGGDTHFYKLRAAKVLDNDRLAVVFSSRENSHSSPSLERDGDADGDGDAPQDAVGNPAEDIGVSWGHDHEGNSGYGGVGSESIAADSEVANPQSGDGASLIGAGLERLGGGRNALAFSVSQLEGKLGPGHKLPGGFHRFTMVATPGRHGLLFLRDGASSSGDGMSLERQQIAVATPTDFRDGHGGSSGSSGSSGGFGSSSSHTSNTVHHTPTVHTPTVHTPTVHHTPQRPTSQHVSYSVPQRNTVQHNVPGSFGSSRPANSAPSSGSDNEVFAYQM